MTHPRDERHKPAGKHGDVNKAVAKIWPVSRLSDWPGCEK